MLPLGQITEAHFDETFDRNVKGVVFGCQVFGEAMVAAGKGSIINLGSESGILPLSRVFTYSASKAAVHNLSKNLAREYGPHNVRINSIAPGLVKTDFAKALWENPENLKASTSGAALGRIGEPREIAGAAVYLASDASSFMTGQTIVVDGGVVV